MCGISTGISRFLAEFYIYRSGSEIFIWRSSESNNVSSLHEYVWQDSTSQNITFISGDRLVFKLYFNVITPGNSTLLYDGANYLSYFTDPTETRYLLNVNNADGTKKLSTSYPAATYGAQTYSVSGSATNASWGIRVWNVTLAGVEQEITSGSPVALVNRTANGGYTAQSNTWACPAANWDTPSNCSLRVKWYAGFNITGSGSGSWSFLINSTTPTPLGSCYINASTWTVTYYTKLQDKTSTPKASLAYDGIEDSLYFYPTRIANIIYCSADFIAPYFYNVIVNENTLASGYNDLYCNWTEIGSVQSTLSKYRYAHNNTGYFTWTSWILAPLGVTTYNLSATVLNNNTVGNVIQVKWECNDTSANLNDTMTYQYYTITSSISWQNPIVWGCWFYRNWSTAIVWNNWFYRNWSSAISWESYFYRNWSLSINWENWFFRNWSSAIYWTDDYLNLTIEIVPGWQPPIVWKFRIGVNPNELAQAGVIALIFFPILLLLIVLLLRRKK